MTRFELTVTGTVPDVRVSTWRNLRCAASYFKFFSFCFILVRLGKTRVDVLWIFSLFQRVVCGLLSKLVVS